MRSTAMPREAPNSGVPLRSRVLVRLFTRYLRWYAARHFRAVRVSRIGLPADTSGQPLIVYTNHPSWWDPALFFLLNDALFAGRPSYGPMEEAALGKYPIFRRLGVFGLEPGARGATAFLRTADAVLANPEAALWITAEGQFTDARARPIALRSGIAHVARRHQHAILLPLALEYTFWNESRPEALARFGAPVTLDTPDDTAASTTQLAAALAATMDALAEESGHRDSALFVALQHGKTGVGGVYDGWRRARAIFNGDRFDPRHEVERG